MPSPEKSKGKILVIDDDPLSQKLTARVVRHLGYETRDALHVDVATRILEDEGIDSFSCVVTDYWMPDKNGSDLIEWICARDRNIGIVVVSAAGDKYLLHKLQQEGAFSFIDKPINTERLIQEVLAAHDFTITSRNSSSTVSEAEELGSVQASFVTANSFLVDWITIHSYPYSQAGGDTIKVFNDGGPVFAVVQADVAGHNLKAAYSSAYFQGLTRGYMDNAQRPLGNVFNFVNSVLYHEFNEHAIKNFKSNDLLSVCVNGIEINFETHNLIIHSHGCPRPLIANLNGEVFANSTENGCPLGWNESLDKTSFLQNFEQGTYLLSWTDGIEEEAIKLGIHPLAAVDQLLKNYKKQKKPDFLEDATDDILVTRIALCESTRSKKLASQDLGNVWTPIYFGEFKAGDETNIDSHQTIWSNSLKFILPEHDTDALHDILLCIREATINAIKYGCSKNPSKIASLTLAKNFNANRMKAIVKDPGEGHDFDWKEHYLLSKDTLVDNHRGLVLMNKLPTKTSSFKQGTHIEMEFNL